MADINASGQQNQPTLLRLPDELLLQIAGHFSVQDVGTFRLAARKCGKVGITELETRLSATDGWDRGITLSPFSESLLNLRAIARSPLQKYCINVTINLDHPHFSLVSSWDDANLHECLEDLRLLRNVERVQYSIELGFQGYLTNVPKDMRHLCWWQRAIPLICKTMEHTARISQGKPPAIYLVFDADRQAPKNIVNGLKFLLRHTTDLIVEEDANTDYEWDGDAYTYEVRTKQWQMQKVHRPDIAMIEAPNLELLCLRKAMPPHVVRHAGVDDVAGTLFSDNFAINFPRLQTLILVNIVLEIDHVEAALETLGPQLRSVRLTHFAMYERYTTDDGRRRGSTVYPFEELMSDESVLRHCIALEELHIDVCSKYVYYCWDNCLCSISQYVDSDLAQETGCIMWECPAEETCWDIGDVYLDLVKKKAEAART